MNYYELTPSPLTGRVAAIEAHADDAAAMMSSALLSARIQGATLRRHRDRWPVGR